MVIESNSYCLTFLFTNTELTANSNGEVPTSEINKVPATISGAFIDLPIIDALYSPDDEADKVVSITDYEILNNKFRDVYPINSFSIPVKTDYSFYLDFCQKLKKTNYKYKYMFSTTARATALGNRKFPYLELETDEYAIPINISDFSPELDNEHGAVKLSFTASKKTL